MSVKSKIMDTLSPLPVDVCFLEREDDGTFPFIVWNFSEHPLMYSDDEEDVVLYLITVNIFSKPDYNFEALKLQIKDLMEDAGFRRTKFPQAEYHEKENVYNQPMGFMYYEEIK